MKLHLLLITVLIFSLSVFGQTPQAGRFAPKNEKFSVIIPGTEIINMSNPFNPSDARAFVTIADNTYFYIFSEPADKQEQSRQIYGFIKAAKTARTEFALNKLKGEQYVFSDAGGFYYRVVLIKTPKRTYAFQTCSPAATSAAIERFFSSIEIDGQNPNLKMDSPAGNLPAFTQADEAAAPPPPAPPQAVPLQITFKERSKYSDFARFYKISGVVRLRITFQANGRIGNIIPILKLPFGLTEKAIEAARGIKFQPATLNGTPIDVTRFVEYNYTVF